MNPKQSNIKEGLVVKVADTNLLAAINAGTDVRGYLVKITTGGKVEIPASATTKCPFVVEDVMASSLTSSAYNVTCRPLTPGSQVRLLATSTGNAGTGLTHDTSAYGKVKAATGGTEWLVGLAEEDWVDGQYVLARYLPYST